MIAVASIAFGFLALIFLGGPAGFVAAILLIAIMLAAMPRK